MGHVRYLPTRDSERRRRENLVAYHKVKNALDDDLTSSQDLGSSPSNQTSDDTASANKIAGPNKPKGQTYASAPAGKQYPPATQKNFPTIHRDEPHEEDSFCTPIMENVRGGGNADDSKSPDGHLPASQAPALAESITVGGGLTND